MTSPSFQTSHATPNPTLDDDDDIAIPTKLRFTLESLKLLIHNPLTADNYLSWSTQVASTFRASKYSKYLDPLTPIPPPLILSQEGQSSPNPLHTKYTLINESLISALIATITPTLHPLILGLPTVADIWSTLKDHLLPQTKSRLTQLKRELHNLTMQGNDLPQFLNRVKSLTNQLEAVGFHVGDDDLIQLILDALPDHFHSFISAFNLLPGPITLPAFYSSLTAEDTNIQRRATTTSPHLHSALATTPHPHHALATTHHHPTTQHPSPPTPLRNPNYKGKNHRPYYPPSNTHHTHPKPNQPHLHSPLECQICKKFGHTADTCRYRYHPPLTSHSSTYPKTANYSYPQSPFLPNTIPTLLLIHHPPLPPTPPHLGSLTPEPPPTSPTNSKTYTYPIPTPATTPFP